MAANNETPAAAAAPSSSITAVKLKLEVAESEVEAAVGFYKAVFGAEVKKMTRAASTDWKPGQELPRLLSAEIVIGSQLILVSGEIQDAPAHKKEPFVMEVEGEYLQLIVLMAAQKGAVQEGITEETECGKLAVKLRDPFGVRWILVNPRPPPRRRRQRQQQQDAESEVQHSGPRD